MAGRWTGLGLALLAGTAVWVQAGAASTAQQRLLETADKILLEISSMRQLSVEGPVAKGIKSREEIRSALEEKVKQEYQPEELEKERKALVKLGLIPADYDYVNQVLGLLQDQLAGYYDPDTRTFYIADWIQGEEQKAAMAHELTHALQDQHFGLKALLESVKGNDDKIQARKAVVEGEAVAVMFDYLLRPQRKSFLNLPNLRQIYSTAVKADAERQKELLKAPEFLRETLLFPYVYGSQFLQVYRRLRSWDEVEELYRRPPSSTEQIMHPSKYTGNRDEPTEVAALEKNPLFGPEWTPVYRNVMGEFGVYLLLKQFVAEATANRAAKGWDGDLVQLFERSDGRRGLFLRTVWDSVRDAEQFFNAYEELVAVKYPESGTASAIDAATQSREWSGGGNTIRMTREGEWVSIWEIEDSPKPALAQ